MTTTVECGEAQTTGIAARHGGYLATLIGTGMRAQWEIRSHPESTLLATYPAEDLDGFAVMQRFFRDQMDVCRVKHQ